MACVCQRVRCDLNLLREYIIYQIFIPGYRHHGIVRNASSERKSRGGDAKVLCATGENAEKIAVYV